MDTNGYDGFLSFFLVYIAVVYTVAMITRGVFASSVTYFFSNIRHKIFNFQANFSHKIARFLFIPKTEISHRESARILRRDRWMYGDKVEKRLPVSPIFCVW